MIASGRNVSLQVCERVVTMKFLAAYFMTKRRILRLKDFGSGLDDDAYAVIWTDVDRSHLMS